MKLINTTNGHLSKKEVDDILNEVKKRNLTDKFILKKYKEMIIGKNLLNFTKSQLNANEFIIRLREKTITEILDRIKNI